MKEILGNNLEQFFFEIFDMIADMSEEKFVKIAGEDAWWRSSNGSVLYSLDKGEVIISNQKMIGWIRKPWDEETSKDINYQSLSEYLCEFIGASMPLSVVACAIDLAKFNHLTMGELFEKYEPVED